MTMAVLAVLWREVGREGGRGGEFLVTYIETMRCILLSLRID